jgi:hypothetical protein
MTPLQVEAIQHIKTQTRPINGRVLDSEIYYQTGTLLPRRTIDLCRICILYIAYRAFRINCSHSRSKGESTWQFQVGIICVQCLLIPIKGKQIGYNYSQIGAAVQGVVKIPHRKDRLIPFCEHNCIRRSPGKHVLSKMLCAEILGRIHLLPMISRQYK